MELNGKQHLIKNYLLKNPHYFDKITAVAFNEKDEEINRLKEEIRKKDEIIKKQNEKFIEEKKKDKEKYNNVKKERDKYKPYYDAAMANYKERYIRPTSQTSSLPPSKDDHNISEVERIKIYGCKDKSDKPKGGQREHKFYSANIDNMAFDSEVIHKRVIDENNNPIFYTDNSFKVVYEKNVKVVTSTVKHIYYIGYTIEGKTYNNGLILTDGINQIRYDDSVNKLITTINHIGLVPYQRTKEIINKITNNDINLCVSSITNIVRNAGDLLDVNRITILNNIKTSNKPIHIDETMTTVNGEKQWVVSFGIEGNILFFTHQKGKKISDELDTILKSFPSGRILVHDHFKYYYGYNNFLHQECNAHIIRYLKGAYYNYNNQTSKELIELFKTAIHEKNILHKNMSYEDVKYYKEEAIRLCKKGLDEPNPSVKGKRYVSNLLNRIIKYIDNHFLFLEYLDVPPTNNLSERSLRMLKSKLKVSGQWVSEHSLNSFLNLQQKRLNDRFIAG
ncbi:MAG: transposase [Acholeplasmatales bacterium]|jgi:hypothetical protein|nr:transposase [Acholeplasmatales bacterium]